LKIQLQTKAKAKKPNKKQREYVAGLKEALHEEDLYMGGKIELHTIEQVLNEF